MTFEIIETQLENLRRALAWLQRHKADVPMANIGRYPQPVIQVRQGPVCAALKLHPKFAATSCGRSRADGIEQVYWQATLFNCRVEWIEPVRQALPICRPFQTGAL